MDTSMLWVVGPGVLDGWLEFECGGCGNRFECSPDEAVTRWENRDRICRSCDVHWVAIQSTLFAPTIEA